MARAFATAAAPADGLTPVQRAVLNSLVESMTGVAVEVADAEPLSAQEFAEALRDRNAGFRARMVQSMLLAEMLLVPIPPEVTARVETYARVAGRRRRDGAGGAAHLLRLARSRADRLPAQRVLRADARATS